MCSFLLLLSDTRMREPRSTDCVTLVTLRITYMLPCLYLKLASHNGKMNSEIMLIV